VVYVNDTTYGLYAFNDSNGQRLWKANGGAAFSTPAVAIGEVYALLGNSLKAYDAAGVTNCSGTPKVCTPLWSGTNVINDTSPVVAGGVVFIGSGGTGVYGYNAGGCGGLSCVPLWTARVTGRLAQGSPAVSDGRVYVASSGTYKVYAYG